MFNVLTAYKNTAWETDQRIETDLDRFKENSEGAESKTVSPNNAGSMKKLENIPTLLLYEAGSEGENVKIVRYGTLQNIVVLSSKLAFQFIEEGRFSIDVIDEFEDRIGVSGWRHRTHWAVKDGGIPSAMMKKLKPTYDVVLSFAGENRTYVEQVAAFLRTHGVKVFYDSFEEANLWGKNLIEHFEDIYRRSGQYCVMFISRSYAEKMWTKHERRSALERELTQQSEYILPARFDATELPGLHASTAYVSLTNNSPTQLGKLILKKLGRAEPV